MLQTCIFACLSLNRVFEASFHVALFSDAFLKARPMAFLLTIDHPFFAFILAHCLADCLLAISVAHLALDAAIGAHLLACTQEANVHLFAASKAFGTAQLIFLTL